MWIQTLDQHVLKCLNVPFKGLTTTVHFCIRKSIAASKHMHTFTVAVITPGFINPCILFSSSSSYRSFKAGAALGGNGRHQRWIQGGEAVGLQGQISRLLLLSSGLVSDVGEARDMNTLIVLMPILMCVVFFLFAAHLSAPLRSSLSVIACTSSKPSIQRWSPAPSTPSSPTWPGENVPPLHPQTSWRRPTWVE